MAKITGFKLREAIKQEQLRKDALDRLLGDSYRAFPGEEKETPQGLIPKIEAADTRIARLQTAQAEYNLKVTLVWEERTLTLAEAVKLIGGVGRLEKMWRKAISEKKTSGGYGVREDERDPQKQYARDVVPASVAMENALAAAARASSLRAAIAVANATEKKVDDELGV